MSLEAIASRYAQALYELGVEQGNLPTLTEEIREVSATYNASADLRGVLSNPVLDVETRKIVLQEILDRLGVSTTVKNTIKLLAERRRLVVLPYLSRALEHLSDERAGIVRATVTTATQLSESYFSQIKEQLEASLGKKVLLERQLDPSLLGGVVTRIGDRVIDGSLRTRLQRMRQTLLTSQ